MKLCVLVSLVCCVAATTLLLANGRSLDDKQWRSFVIKYNKSFASAHEESMRREIFFKNRLTIEQHNRLFAQRMGFKLGLNRFADVPRNELDANLKGFRPTRERPSDTINGKRSEFLERLLEVDENDLPIEVDWRKVVGRVSPIKDQRDCNSDWAFATTGVLEGQQVNVNMSQLRPLSEQNLIDCSNSKHNKGCRCGDFAVAMDDIANRLHGIESELDYPYQAVSSSCVFNQTKSVMTIKGYQALDGTEASLKKAVALFGPVAAAIDTTERFDFYTNGIIDDNLCDPYAADHSILVVGYGVDIIYGDYWIGKNSWNTDWGEEGFFRIARNKNNMCGIATYATIATL